MDHLFRVSSFGESLCKNLSYENEFDLRENEPVDRTHFHMNGLTCKLALTQRQKTT